MKFEEILPLIRSEVKVKHNSWSEGVFVDKNEDYHIGMDEILSDQWELYEKSLPTVKDCPFCGLEAKCGQYDEYGKTKFETFCRHCGCTTLPKETAIGSINIWNNRV